MSVNHDFNVFQKDIEALAFDIKAHYTPYETKDEFEFMGDGLVNLEQYYKARPKILWILKEPYDEDGGGWSISELFNLSGSVLVSPKHNLHKSKTWLPVIYSSYAIHNGMMPWDWIGYPDKEPEVVDALKNIAVMNILKIPGNTTTPPAKLKAGYNQHREILLRQLKTYNPDVIIGGNTLWHFHKDLELDKGEFCSDYEHEFWLKDGKVYIHCAHPSTTNRSEKRIETYVDGITEIVKLWAGRTAPLQINS
jgi:hypothetical protein